MQQTRQKSAADLIASEMRYRRLFETAKDGILIIHADTGKIVDANPFFLDILGYSLEEISGKELWEVGLFKDIAASKAAFLKLKDKGYVRYEYLPLETKDGKTLEVEFVSNVYQVNGIKVIQCNIRDITDRKNMKMALLKEKNRVQQYWDIAGTMLLAFDVNGKVRDVNNKGCEILEYDKKDIIGKNWFNNFIPKRMREDVKVIFKKIISGDIKPLEYVEGFTIVPKSGKEKLISWHNSVILSKDGKIIGILSSGEDVTIRKQAEEEHRQNIEYRELDRLKTNLLSTVSHELRTPLASIKGYASLLLMYNRRLASQQKRESLEAIDRSTDRLTELIEHLLDMSRLNAGMLRLNMASVKPSAILLAAVTEARLRAPKYRFSEKIKRQLPTIIVDSKRLRQVIDNLLDNAIKYSPKGTEISVCSEIKREELLVSVIDHGQGIAAQELKKIFDRFYRIEQRLAKDPGGLGLGLSLCSALVKAHGGKIWAESEVGKGSTFYFTIPVKSEKPDASKK